MKKCRECYCRECYYGDKFKNKPCSNCIHDPLLEDCYKPKKPSEKKNIKKGVNNNGGPYHDGKGGVMFVNCSGGPAL